MLTIHLLPRQVAVARGLRHYFTGKPCLRGHIDERHTERKYCLACKLEKDREKLALPGMKAKRAAYDRARWENDRDYIVAKNKRYYAENADAVNEQKRGYWAKNVEAMTTANRAWREENPHVLRHHNALRKKRIQRATPSWADIEAIKAVYAQAEQLSGKTGVLHHVDHIVPITGKNVCGLHVHWNLRPLPWRDNLSKKNKFDEELVLAS